MPRRTPYRCRQASWRKQQRGAIAIVVGLSMAVLIGFVGLALDLGKLYVAKSELQNSADACALAAARDVTGATPLAISEAAGITAGRRNLAMFQKEEVALTADSSVTYSDSLDHPFMDKNSVIYPLKDIRYVQCFTSRAGISNWFIEILNVLPGIDIGPQTVSSTAVATTGSAQTACAIPIMACDPSKLSPASSYTPGQWLLGKLDADDPKTYGGGNFGWANLTPKNNGTPDLAKQLVGSGQCSLPALGTEIGTAGNKVSLSDAWNSRFGIVQKVGEAIGVPDFTGYAYNTKTWKTTWNGVDPGNAYPDFLVQRGKFKEYQGDDALQLPKPGTQGQPSSNDDHKKGADRRLVLMPLVDCSKFGKSGTPAPVTGWACVLMVEPMIHKGNESDVHVEYRGRSDTPGSPCATQGIPGEMNGVGPLVPVLVR
ncbi:pilus assembly protein TadG-related protein [Cupriavidus oxalaticus]|uniref:pilus assembly protein TadG-related protein n=1 Tax=Cupriavidus oxalaticus TaxID=96344 RepID=UPI004034D5D0